MPDNSSSKSETSCESEIDLQPVISYLSGLSYPASRVNVIDRARLNKAPENVIQILSKLPGKRFKNAADLENGLKEIDLSSREYPLTSYRYKLQLVIIFISIIVVAAIFAFSGIVPDTASTVAIAIFFIFLGIVLLTVIIRLIRGRWPFGLG